MYVPLKISHQNLALLLKLLAYIAVLGELDADPASSDAAREPTWNPIADRRRKFTRARVMAQLKKCHTESQMRSLFQGDMMQQHRDKLIAVADYLWQLPHGKVRIAELTPLTSNPKLLPPYKDKVWMQARIAIAELAQHIEAGKITLELLTEPLEAQGVISTSVQTA